MKPTYSLIFLFFVCFQSPAFSQSDPNNSTARNSFYFEALGNAILYSVNYDRIFLVNEKSALVGRIGVTYAPPPDQGPGVVMELNLLLGSGKHHFELGAGSTYYYLFSNDEMLVDSSLSMLFFTTRVGYRFQKKEGGFLFRAGFVPMFGFSVDQDFISVENNFIPFGGISFGYTLKIKK